MMSVRARVATVFASAAVIVGLLSACDGPVVIPIIDAHVSADGLHLELAYNACDATAGATVEESPDVVKVYLMAYRPVAPTGTECLGHADVELKAPLGDRVLKDTYTDEVIKVSHS